jgi:hypothetical protein
MTSHLGEMETSGYGSYPVTVLPHVLVTLPDGQRLALKVWFPSKNSTSLDEAFGTVPSHVHYAGKEPSKEDKLTETFPVVMEYLPYRKSDFTVPRDYRRHAWIASHGYVCVRVDMRGTGEYSE